METSLGYVAMGKAQCGLRSSFNHMKAHSVSDSLLNNSDKSFVCNTRIITLEQLTQRFWEVESGNILVQRKRLVKGCFRHLIREERMGYLSKVNDPSPDTHAYYMPHRVVYWPEKDTSKTRVVLDAGCKTTSDRSLNDLLYPLRASVMFYFVRPYVTPKFVPTCLFKMLLGMIGSAISFLIFMKSCSAVIYSINESEYDKFPPLYALDDYESCMVDPTAVYCLGDYDLYSDGKSDLMTTLQRYSDYTLKHFNHTQIHRGVCVTRTCKKYIENRTLTKAEDLEVILVACLNESVWNDYELQVKLNNIRYCNRADKKNTIDVSDAVMMAIYFILIVLNAIGSFYDSKYWKKKFKVNPYLLAFSVRKNWAKLIAPSTRGSDLRLDRLKLFNGLRTITMICVFFSHATLVMSYSYISNPLFVEKAYDDPLKQLLYNGSLVTHSFFVMSAFLLAYNLQIHSEKHTIRWTNFPKGVLQRWLRLTPMYALMMGTIATWMRHFGDGPLWPLVVTSESEACRQYWWAHILYFNNYIYDDALCTPQTWYLASDTQMFCLCLFLCVAVKTPRSRKIVLAILFVYSLLVVAAHTYFENLDAVVLQKPESFRTIYAYDDTFRLLYSRGHTNLSTYTLGLAGGFLTYYLQNEKTDLKNYKNYRWAFWLLFPMGVAVILSGGIFYIDGITPSTALNVVYATLYKPIFQILVVAFIIGCILKFETVYRGIVEWRGFTWCGRVSYITFFVHTLLQRAYLGLQTTPYHISGFNITILLLATTAGSFLIAALLWILVEAPIAGITKALLQPQHKHVQNQPPLEPNGQA
ncbi:O-acyltransferase like protein-like [Aphomia sociella]